MRNGNFVVMNIFKIRNVTEAIRNDNRFIFNQLSLLKGKDSPDMAIERWSCF